MAVIDVPLPDLGEDAGSEARVAFWYVDVGEEVKQGDDLEVNFRTGDIKNDVPSPATGKVADLMADEEQTVKVGGVLCRLQVED